tara:strand:- start:140 stop:1480 length:1341 start_codon:yes stop_codon:yes gene_type:complete
MNKNESQHGPKNDPNNGLKSKPKTLGIIGMGYVGLPLGVVAAEAGHTVIGFDVNPDVVNSINQGASHIQDVPSQSLSPLVNNGQLRATTDFSELKHCDVISICVPTPLNKIKDPDLSYVVNASEDIAEHLQQGQTVILESTTYPGTSREVVLPILEESGLTVGVDFYLCYSPERVDPGNQTWTTKNTPKVLGGITEECAKKGEELYQTIFDQIVLVENTEAAELVKVYENTFRMINIALANELSQVCDRLGINVWDVIDAAATKPFGFMKFTPGPGLGGHCIPLDPHYLSWKMRTLSFKTRMIELASEINAEMPEVVVEKILHELNDQGKSIKNANVLILGVSYKKDIDDLRESPALDILYHLERRGALIQYHDPFCPIIRADESLPIHGLPMESQPLTKASIQKADVVVIVTDHTDVDYELVASQAKAIVDTRGVIKEPHTQTDL